MCVKQHLGAPQPCDMESSTYQGAGRSPWQLLIRSLRRDQPVPLFQPHPCSLRSWIPALGISSPSRQVGLAMGLEVAQTSPAWEGFDAGV